MQRSLLWVHFIASISIVLASTAPAHAHWCSNIFTSPSRIVVKPEKNPVFIGTTPVQLRIYLQNNFPYRLYQVKMRGNASGYTIQNPTSVLDVFPGQNVGFVFSITKNSGSATVDVSTLNIEVFFRDGEWPNKWLSPSDCMLSQDPSESFLIYGATNLGAAHCDDYNQSTSLNAATLADLYSSATLGSGGPPNFNWTGLQKLMVMFGYRFCYDQNGTWRCGNEDCIQSGCPSNLTYQHWGNIDQFPQDCMRAGVELAARRASLGSGLATARAAATNALKGTDGAAHKCLAAVVGAYLWQGAPNTSSFTSTLSQVSSNCAQAAQRILDGAAVLDCAAISNPALYYEQAACAAAEGLRDNDTPVKDILMVKAGDGYKPAISSDYYSGYDTLYYAYMLYLVTAHRRAAYSVVSYYGDAGGPIPDGNPPSPDLKQPADMPVVPPDTQGPVSDQSPPLPDSPGPITDTIGPITDTIGPITDTIGPITDTIGPITDGQPIADTQKPIIDTNDPVSDTMLPPDSQHPTDGPEPTEGGLADATIKQDGPPKHDGTITSETGPKKDQTLEGGCSCRYDDDASPAEPWALLLGLVIVFRRRRRDR